MIPYGEISHEAIHCGKSSVSELELEIDFERNKKDYS